MRTVFAFCVVLLGLAFFVPSAGAESRVSVSGVVQDYGNVTPVADVVDTLNFSVGFSTDVSDVTAIGVLVQQTATDNYLTFVTVDYGLPRVLPVDLYAGFGLGINFADVADEGFVILGNAGVKFRVYQNIGAFLGARSLTWFTADKGVDIGVVTGLSVSF